MTELYPGIHPNFDIAKFDVPEQRVLRRMSQLFHLTRDGQITIGAGDSKYRYAFVKPTQSMKGYLHTDREVVVVFSSYAMFQPRTLDAFDHIIDRMHEEFRLEKVVRILISGDLQISKKLKALFNSKPDAPIVIPFHTSEFSLAAADKDIVGRIREFTFSRDLFSVSSPLKSDLYFYGRNNLINEIVSKLSSGENFGLFGLRRSGKTSLVSGVGRALQSRGGRGIAVDCQSPSVHQLRWNELLRLIANQVRKENSLSLVKEQSGRYDIVNASESFVTDMIDAKKKLNTDFLVILFDEVERISFGTASSPHWNNERDFLLFWQSIRFGFQSASSPFTFLIVGTNPSSIERDVIFESDNPLFGNVEKRFIPMFTEQQVAEMVDELGSIMGTNFDQDCKSRLFQDFGGHPFLTRHACSYISKQVTERPILIDRTVYAAGVNAFSVESDTYVESVVGLLQKEYKDEHEMLKYLGQGDSASFEGLAKHDARLVEHLKGYGIIAQGNKAYYFNIGVVEKYFSKLEKPSTLLGQSDRKAEISRRRNEIEAGIRKYIFGVATVVFTKKERREKIVDKLAPLRREAISVLNLKDLFLSDSSPLYFTELTSIICGHWDIFQNSLGINKSEFEYHMNTINTYRVDAHPKGISDSDFDKVRVSLSTMEKEMESS